MRFIIPLVLALSSASAAAQKTYYWSARHGDLCLMVCGIGQITRPTEPSVARADEMLLFGVRPVTNAEAVIQWPEDHSFLCTAELFDSAGKAVPKTTSGAKLGQSFAAFDPQKTRLNRRRTGQDEGPSSYLFRPKDVFAVEKAGAYTLRLKLQVVHLREDRPAAGAGVVVFERLDVPVVFREAD